MCNAPLPTEAVADVRAALPRRRQTFKGRLGRLEQRMHSVTDGPLAFVTRGIPRDDNEHLTEVIRPALASLCEHHETVARLLSSGSTWDPREAGCIQAFTELIGVLDTGLNFVTNLRETMPPVEWRAVHRELTRAAAQLIRGQVLITLTIIAPDADAAAALQEEGQQAIDLGARHTNQAARLIKLIADSPSDGPFQLDGSLDFAGLAWSSVGQTTTSITNSAKVLREAFAGMPSIATLADEHAVVLLPLFAMGARVIDRQVLVERTRALRATLDAADAASAWITEPALLATRLHRGLEQATSEMERLGREWRHGLPREHVLRSQTEVYRQLVESTFRDFGGVLLVAARTSRGDEDGTYEIDIIDGIQAGEIVTELQRLGTPYGGSVDMIYRNASAHADIDITNTGISATERRISGGRVVSTNTVSLSDAEFAEELIALQEILLAFQLTVLPWAWGHGDSAVASAITSVPLSAVQIHRTLALVGGLAGLHDLAVSVDDDHAEIRAVRHPDDADRREMSILSLVPAAFAAMPGTSKVTLHIAELHPVTFGRTEFGVLEADDAPHSLVLLGLISAKWLLQSDSSSTERDEATYVTFPLTQLHFACARLVGTAPHSDANIDQAIDSIRLSLARLDEVLPAKHRRTPTTQAVAQLTILKDALTGLVESRRGQRSQDQAQGFAQQAVGTFEAVYQIQEDAKALRDAVE